MLGGSVHGEVLRVHVLFLGGGNLRRRRPVQSFPVRGHTKRDSRRSRRAHGGRAGKGAEIGVVYGVYIYIGISIRRIKGGVLNFGRSFPFDGIQVHRTRKADPRIGGSHHAAGSHLGNDGMGGGAVHHDARLFFFCTAFAEFFPVRREVYIFRGKENVVLRSCNRDVPRTRRRKGAAFHQRVGAAGDLVDGNRRAQSRLGVRANGEAPGEVVEAVVASRHRAHAAVRCEILVLDDSVYVVVNVVVAPGAGKGNCPVHSHSSPDARGMDVAVSGGAHLSESDV